MPKSRFAKIATVWSALTTILTCLPQMADDNENESAQFVTRFASEALKISTAEQAWDLFEKINEKDRQAIDRVGIIMLVNEAPDVRAAALERLSYLLDSAEWEFHREKARFSFDELSSADTEVVLNHLQGDVRDQESEFARAGAIRVLGEMGSAAKEAIPLLKDSMQDDYALVEFHAMKALGRLTSVTSAQTEPFQLPASFDQEQLVKISALLHELRDNPKRIKHASDSLMDLHDHPQAPRPLQHNILWTLAHSDTVGSRYLDALLSRFQYKKDLRERVFDAERLIRILARRTQFSEDTVRVIIKYLRSNADRSPFTARAETSQSQKIMALWLISNKFGKEAAVAADAVVADMLYWQLSDLDPDIHPLERREIGACLDAIRAMGTSARESRGNVLSGIRDVHQEIARHDDLHRIRFALPRIYGYLLVTLAEIDPPDRAGRETVAALELASSSEHPHFRNYVFTAATKVASELGGQAMYCVPYLVKRLNTDPNSSSEGANFHGIGAYQSGPDFIPVQLAIVRALGRIGPAADAALPKLRQIAAWQIPEETSGGFSSHSDWNIRAEIRRSAAESISAISPK